MLDRFFWAVSLDFFVFSIVPYNLLKSCSIVEK